MKHQVKIRAIVHSVLEIDAFDTDGALQIAKWNAHWLELDGDSVRLEMADRSIAGVLAEVIIDGIDVQ